MNCSGRPEQRKARLGDGECVAGRGDGDPAATRGAGEVHSSFWGDTSVLWVLGLSSLILHLVTASRPDYYIDEMYIWAAAKHLSLGYADEFPMQVWLMWLATSALGGTKFAIRLLPAVWGSANILAAGLLARELGGKRFAISLTGLGVFASPFLMFAATFANAWSYDCLFWTLSAVLVARILRTGNGRLWWAVGVVWGVGLLTKPTVLLFMAGIGLAFLLTGARKELLKKGYWAALALSFVMLLPAVAWQTAYGWPILHMMTAMQSDEYSDFGNWLAYFSREKMLSAQPAWLGPFNCVLVAVGLFHGLVSGRKEESRVILWAAVFAFMAFMATLGFTFYTSPTYAVLLACGCVSVGQITAEKRLLWARLAMVLVLAAQGLVAAPLCMPVLPTDRVGPYASVVGRCVFTPLNTPADILQGKDENEPVAKVFGKVYASLPDSDKEDCCIIIGSSSQAACTAFFRDKYGLPEVFSPHLSFSCWGPPKEETKRVIATQFSRKELERWFERVEYLGNFGSDQSPGIFLCKSPRRTYAEIWRDMCNKDSSYRWRVDFEGGQK